MVGAVARLAVAFGLVLPASLPGALLQEIPSRDFRRSLSTPSPTGGDFERLDGRVVRSRKEKVDGC